MRAKIVDIHTHRAHTDTLSITSWGVHPWHSEEVSEPLDATLFGGYDAVGEIGLDRCCRTPMDTQRRLFEEQLEIAQKLNKIVVIHCVKAYNETLEALFRYAISRVIFHGFIGSVELMRQITNRGYYISYGERTFSSPKTVEALRATPIDKLFLETDQSETDIRDIYNRAASILNIEESILQGEIYNNYKQILR